MLKNILISLLITFSLSIKSYSYIPVGIQNDVAFDTVINDWGWEVVYRGPYSASGVSPNVYLNGIQEGDAVMLAGLNNSTMTFDVLAATTFEHLTTVTPQNQPNENNGALWYYNDQSIGFAGIGDSINQSSADINGQNSSIKNLKTK